MLGKIDGRRIRGQQKIRWLESITDLVEINFSKLQEIMKDRETSCTAAHGGHKELDMT